MRFVVATLFIFLNLFGCGTRIVPDRVRSKQKRSVPDVDLSKSIYFIPQPSFWSGCETSWMSDKLCRFIRAEQVRNGVNAWLEYLDPSNRPAVVIFPYDGRDIPFDNIGNVIYLSIDKDGCKESKAENAIACYFYKQRKIVFIAAEHIGSTSAHEFGHALGRGDNDVPEGTPSVMSYKHPVQVSPLDFEMMCRLHVECRSLKRRK